eukprot:gene317-40950_t
MTGYLRSSDPHVTQTVLRVVFTEQHDGGGVSATVGRVTLSQGRPDPNYDELHLAHLLGPAGAGIGRLPRLRLSFSGAALVCDQHSDLSMCPDPDASAGRLAGQFGGGCAVLRAAVG